MDKKVYRCGVCETGFLETDSAPECPKCKEKEDIYTLKQIHNRHIDYGSIFREG